MRKNSTTKTRLPTRNDVARHASVSGWTVSHVLNGNHSVSISSETRSRVIESARLLGYRPNSNARALATGRSSMVGFWMSFLYSQHRAHVLHCMQNVMKNSDFELIIRDIEDELLRDAELSSACKIPVDGIIAFDTPQAGKTFIRTNEASIPFVSMGAFWAEDGDYVGTDLYPGSREAVQHLVDTGRKHIIYLMPGSLVDVKLEARGRAYMDVMAEAGLELRAVRLENLAVLTAWKTVHGYVMQHPDVDAIFCHNDEIAFGAHRALSDLGRKIGPEVAIVGCDGVEETDYLSPPISTIVQPIDEMCALAWQFLQNRIVQPSIPLQQRVLKPRFLVRTSSQR